MQPDILDRLFEKYYNEAMLYAFTLCRNKDLAEDLVAEAFYKALSKLTEEITHFKFWLLRVIKTTYIDYLRKNKRHIKLQDNIVDETEDMASKLIRNEQYAELYKAIDKLDDYYREIITLHYFQDLKFKEIGEILDKTEAQIKSAAYEARQKLKRLLEEEQDGRK
ncbi:MAG TPA: RNA polymerase sigma factor [Clostridia bacterium]|jgi:RNA polymerase sigma-70 factor (ECF subfamily)|nr:RNA polymerase sigma factor [Clostridia bacterium]